MSPFLRLEWSCVLVLLLLATAAHGSTSPVCVARDRDALLAFKAGLRDNGGQLASWTEHFNCCVFEGVTCDATGQVVNVTFFAAPDDECDEEPCDNIQSLAGNPNKENLLGKTLSKLKALQVLNLTNFFLHDVTPTGLSALENLTVLSLVESDFKGPFSTDIGKIKSLKYLSFEGSLYITLPLPQNLCQLSNLQTLILPGIGFGDGSVASPIPSCLSELRQLQVLDLQGAAFNGRFPVSLKQLKNLKQLLLTGFVNILGNALSLPGAGLTGALPRINPGDLPALELLYLEDQAFVGSIPDSFSNLLSLQELRIGGESRKRIKLTGPIPASFGKLTKLRVLSIQYTDVSGSIPKSLTLLPALTDLLLNDNKLSGSIPSDLGATGVIVNLGLDRNSFSGVLPAFLGGANKKLLTFSASGNDLTGEIPVSFTLLHLALLDLSFNQLTGEIPARLGYAISEDDQQLDLSHNQLTGALNGPSLWQVRQVAVNNNKLTSLGTGTIPNNDSSGILLFNFFAQSNQLAGAVPDWVFQISFASTIDISDNKLTKLPVIDVSRLFGVSLINISFNAFSGPIPPALTQGSFSVDIHHNSFSGSIPSFNGSRARVIILGDNLLTGPIPSDIFTELTIVVILNNNKLTGSIPEVPADGFLQYVDLSNNELTGTIPASLLPNIVKLKLGNNKLSGPIPDFSASCFTVLSITLENNKLTGPILPPGADLGFCTGLAVYDVSGNLLDGTIPEAITAFTGLQVLDVGNNAISGTVGTFLSNLHALTVLDVSNNRLTGPLPLKELVAGFTALAVAGNVASGGYTPGDALYSDGYIFNGSLSLTGISYLFSTTPALVVSGNSLTGPIDPSVGQLKGLLVLDLSHNKFTGSVPATIANIPFLEYLNLSFNMLKGRIPAQLKGFPASSFAGNPGLCGPPSSQAC